MKKKIRKQVRNSRICHKCHRKSNRWKLAQNHVMNTCTGETYIEIHPYCPKCFKKYVYTEARAKREKLL